MEQHDNGGTDWRSFDARVRARRPEPGEDLVNRLLTAPRSSRRAGRPLRLIGAVGFVSTLAAVLAVTGAFGYADSSIRQDVVKAKDLVALGTQTPLNSPADQQYRPGKGCGDKNHLHDRNYQCKVNINDVTVKEGKSGTRAMLFTVSLNATAVDTVTVDFATADGSATAPDDYLATRGTITFNKGASSTAVTVLVVGDTTREATESFSLLLSNASANAIISDSKGIGTITNDD